MYEEFIGTQPVAERQRFDVAKLEAYLTAHVKAFAGPLTVEQFKGGQSNPTFKLVTPSRAYVMRAKPGPAAKLLQSAHAIEREYRVMDAAEGHRRAGREDAWRCARTRASSVARST